MKKLELQKMENLAGGVSCTNIMRRGDFTRSDACVMCSGFGGMAGGAIFGGGVGALTGWVGGIVNGLFTC